jgi:hypothetical protein
MDKNRVAGAGKNVAGKAMRKRIIPPTQQRAEPPATNWLQLEELAEVEVTSESPAYPIEAALLSGGSSGWRADAPGTQTIRLLFRRPQVLKRIWLSFMEPDMERTQEYVLRWSPDAGRSFHDVVRQQWNFNPRGATSETEDHHVELPAVTVLELSITPHTSGGTAVASLAQLRLA